MRLSASQRVAQISCTDIEMGLRHWARLGIFLHINSLLLLIESLASFAAARLSSFLHFTGPVIFGEAESEFHIN